MMRALVLRYVLSSLQSGVLVPVVLLVCSLLRRSRAPSRCLCWLWLAVGARFVLPGIPLVLPRRTGAALAKTADALRVFPAAAGPSAAGPVTGTQPPAVAGPYHAADTIAAPAAVPWYDRLTVWHFLAVLWAAVACILLLRTVVGYLRLSRKMALAYRTHDGAYTCAAVRTPFTMGLLRPRIYLPPDLTGSARRHVLAHEVTHIRRGDTVTKPLFYLIACLHWFNPLVWLAYGQFLRVMECACDEAAVQGLPAERRADYCKVILHFATVQGQPAPGSLSFGRGSTKERVARVMRYRRPGRGRLTVCAAAVLLTMTACMVQPTAADGASSAPQTTDPAAPAPGSDAGAGPGTDAADDTAETGPVIYYDIQELPVSEEKPASEIGSAGRRNLEWGEDNRHLDISTRRYDETGRAAVFKQTPFTTAKSRDDFAENAAPCYDAYVWDTDHYLAAGIPDEDPGAGSLVFYETFDDGANWRETKLDVAAQIGTAVIDGVELGNYDTGELWCAVTTDQDRLYVYERTGEGSWSAVTEFENTCEPGWYEHVWMISPTQGWATIDARYSRTPWLFVTTDGRNWERVTVRDKETGQTPPINFLGGIGRRGDTLMLTADYDSTPGEMGGEFHSLFSTDNGKTWHMDWPLTGWPAAEAETG